MLHQILLRTFPSARGNIFVADKEYVLPTVKDVRKLLDDSHADRFKYTPETFDCDDFALALHSWVRKHQILSNYPHPIALGECWGRMFRGEKTMHAINLAVLDTSRVILIEPQNDSLWYAHPDYDDVYYIRI